MLLPECAELDAYRLARDWTWEKLAEAMAEQGITMSPRTLHYLVKRAHPDIRPRDRTLYKIREFLKYVRVVEKRRMSRRKAKPVVRPTQTDASAS